MSIKNLTFFLLIQFFNSFITNSNAFSQSNGQNNDSIKFMNPQISKGGLKIENLIKLGSKYEKNKQYENAIWAYKEVIRESRSSDSNSYENNIKAYTNYRRIVLDISKDYKLANQLADSIYFYSELKAKKQESILSTDFHRKELKQLYYFFGAINFVIFIAIFFYQKLRSANAQLHELNQSREKLITIIAHDLKSPINSFQVFGDVIKYLLAKKDYSKLIEVSLQIEQSGLQMSNLLYSLLKWGMSNFELKPTNPEAICIKSFIEEIINYYKNILSVRNIELEVNVISNTLVNTDKNSLSLILRNLLDNAIKYTPIGKKITIETEQIESKVHLIISNEHEGVSKERIEEIRMLFREKKYTDIGERNFGIGLVLVSQFAKINQLNITLTTPESNLLRFTVEIPK
jgi:signal transduction histidine kinase